jgi:hypothetical protein
VQNGVNIFEVRARWGPDTDPSPAARNFVTDTVVPDTTITSKPASVTSATSATFDFIANEAAVTFECKLDTSNFAPCARPFTYTGLSRATHTFQVRARDAAGNVDASPATYTWRVS